MPEGRLLPRSTSNLNLSKKGNTSVFPGENISLDNVIHVFSIVTNVL
jgi:hypothetical protein